MCLAVQSLTVLFYLVFSISATPSSVCNHPSVLWLSPFYLYTNNECQLTNFQQVHQVTTCNQRRPQTCLTENLTGPLPNIKSPQKAKPKYIYRTTYRYTIKQVLLWVKCAIPKQLPNTIDHQKTK